MWTALRREGFHTQKLKKSCCGALPPWLTGTGGRVLTRCSNVVTGKEAQQQVTMALHTCIMARACTEQIAHSAKGSNQGKSRFRVSR